MSSSSVVSDPDASNLYHIKHPQAFHTLLDESLTNNNKLYVVMFWADWHPPCKQMMVVIETLAKTYSQIIFITVEAEEYPEITEKYPVQSVPTTVFIRNGAVIGTFEGANASELSNLVANHSKTVISPLSDQKAPSPATSSTDDLNTRLKTLINSSPVMIFIKGTPETPRCGFTRQLLTLLNDLGINYGSFDILSDNVVREGLKTYSNWPTYPQVYINGELIGGLDIIKELHANNELIPMIPVNMVKNKTIERCKELINQSRVMLFMKGTPEDPQCGFSNRAVEILRQHGFTFGSFNIFSDESIRQALKEYSNWPTYPQLYIDGELIGGVDVMEEMSQSGELDELKKKVEA